ncbi:MAG: PepSY domain-containing protein [Planctomycetota bacterium]
MKKVSWYVRASVIVAALGLIALPVYAHCGKCAGDCKKMTDAMGEAKVTLSKAIEAAEAQGKGKALSANTSMKDGKLEMTVYCLAGDKLQEIHVDGKTGKAGEAKDIKALP